MATALVPKIVLTVNHASGAGYYAMAGQGFDPDFILVSAGFDAHEHDPLAGLNWTTEDFGWITSQLCSLAHEMCDGRLVSVLEGGYDLNALADAARAHVDELMKAAP